MAHFISLSIIYLILQLVIIESNGSPVPSPSFEEDVDLFAEEMIGCRDILGLSLAIVRGNQTILTKGYGYKDTEQTTQVFILYSSLIK